MKLSDLTDTIDPCVVIKCGGETRNTTAHENATKVSFNESFLIPVSQETLDSGDGFEICIYDKDGLSGDDKKASITIAFPEPLSPVAGASVELDPAGRLTLVRGLRLCCCVRLSWATYRTHAAVYGQSTLSLTASNPSLPPSSILGPPSCNCRPSCSSPWERC